ncbi:MAG TPA: BrnA antitoxin family protein [Casimicrobiaceae bacterium]
MTHPRGRRRCSRVRWSSMVLRRPPTKTLLSLRIDRDVVEWFRAQGRGYQSRMNALLRAYMEAHRR